MLLPHTEERKRAWHWLQPSELYMWLEGAEAREGMELPSKNAAAGDFLQTVMASYARQVGACPLIAPHGAHSVSD